MSDRTSSAQHLANVLLSNYEADEIDEAANELRRLDEVNRELLEALKSCSERLQIHMAHSEDLVAHMRAVEAIDKATNG